MKKIAFVVPCFNEDQRVAEFLKNLRTYLLAKLPQLSAEVIVIDDASQRLVEIPSELKLSPQESFHVTILRHKVNLGQGAALETGFEFVRRNLDPDVIVTMDSDGQHRPQDLLGLVTPILEEKYDLVLGTRFGDETGSNVPKLRKLLLLMAVRFENFVTGSKLSDSHNGFRAFNKKTLHVLHLRQARMAHATEIKILARRHKLKITEVPTKILYTKESLEKGQRSLGALYILRDLARAYFFDHG